MTNAGATSSPPWVLRWCVGRPMDWDCQAASTEDVQLQLLNDPGQHRLSTTYNYQLTMVQTGHSQVTRIAFTVHCTHKLSVDNW